MQDPNIIKYPCPDDCSLITISIGLYLPSKKWRAYYSCQIMMLSTRNFSIIQTTVRTEIILNCIPTIRRLWHFFRTSRNMQFCTLDDEIEAIGSPGKLATIETVAQCLMGNILAMVNIESIG